MKGLYLEVCSLVGIHYLVNACGLVFVFFYDGWVELEHFNEIIEFLEDDFILIILFLHELHQSIHHFLVVFLSLEDGIDYRFEFSQSKLSLALFVFPDKA